MIDCYLTVYHLNINLNTNYVLRYVLDYLLELVLDFLEVLTVALVAVLSNSAK